MLILEYTGTATLNLMSIGLGSVATNAILTIPQTKYQSFVAAIEAAGSSLSDFINPNSTAAIVGLTSDSAFLYANTPSTTAGTTIQAGSGTFYGLTINKTVVSAVVTIYDGTSTGGTKIGTITLPGTLLTEGPITSIYNVHYSVGLFVVVATGACDITWAYKPD